jgi:hypothetical protein
MGRDRNSSVFIRAPSLAYPGLRVPMVVGLTRWCLISFTSLVGFG